MTEADLKNVLACIHRVKDFTVEEFDEVAGLKRRIAEEINSFHTPASPHVDTKPGISAA